MSVMYTIVCNWSNVLYMHACVLLRQLVESKNKRRFFSDNLTVQ